MTTDTSTHTVETTAGAPCVLLPEASAPAPGSLALTGAELILPLAVGSAILALGIALVVTAVRRRRRGNADGGGGAAIVVALLSALTLAALPLAAPEAVASEQPTSGEPQSCELIRYSVDRSGEALIGSTEVEIEQATVTNVTDGVIEVSFSAQVTEDEDELAPYVHMKGSCRCTPSPLLDSVLGTGIASGTSVRLTAGSSVTVSVTANTTAEITNVHQGTRLTYALVAHAREARA